MCWGARLGWGGCEESPERRVHKEAPSFNLHANVGQIKKKNEEFRKRIRKLARKHVGRKEEFYKNSPPHLEYTRRTKNWGMLSDLLEMFGYSDKELIGPESQLAGGFTYDGEVKPTHIFSSIPDCDAN